MSDTLCQGHSGESDQDDLGPTEEPNGWCNGAHASCDEDSARRSLDETVKIFLSILRGDDKGTQAGENDLATVRVATQNQADAAIAKRLDKVRIVREHDDGIAVRGVTKGSAQVLLVGSEVADSREPQPCTIPFEPDARIVQDGEPCLGQCRDGEGLEISVVSVIAVVVIAKDRISSESGFEPSQLGDPRRDVGLMMMHVIASQENEIGLKDMGHRHDIPDVR